MKLSIFPKCKALPKSKEEKQKYARYTSRPHMPEIFEVNNENDLIEIVTNYSWSPFLFEDFRRQDGFISTDFAVFDIDEGMRIEEAEKIIEDMEVACLCLPSTSHSEKNHRFRLIFPLSKSIKDKEEYVETMMKLGESFPYDSNCLTDIHPNQPLGKYRLHARKRFASNHCTCHNRGFRRKLYYRLQIIEYDRW